MNCESNFGMSFFIAFKINLYAFILLAETFSTYSKYYRNNWQDYFITLH